MTDPLRIMVYRHSAFYTPLLAAMAGRFLADEDLEPEYFVKPKSRNLYEMFRSGEVDVMQAAVSTSWDPLSRGIREIPMHFAQINQRDGFFLTGRRPEPDFHWKRLEGARIVADHSQQPLAMLRYALHLEGVDIERVGFIKTGPPEAMVEAFRNGDGDYVHLQGPAPQELEEGGIGAVVARVGDVIPPVAFSTLMALPEFLETDRARRFVRAYRRALLWADQTLAEAIAETESRYFPDVSRSALAGAIAQYQELGTWRTDPEIPRDQYEVAMDVFIQTGIFSRRFPYEDVVVPPPA
jgi:NitT/TauT family transport system substrate-binding protein